MVNGRVRCRGDARLQMLPQDFFPQTFLRGRRGFGCTVDGNTFASSTQNCKSRFLCFLLLAPHPNFQCRGVFGDFLFSVVCFTGFISLANLFP